MKSAAFPKGQSRPSTREGTGQYQSRMLEKYLWHLSRREKPQILDVGPVCSRNVDFFLHYTSVLHIGDIARRLGPVLKQGLDTEQVLRFFDFAPGSLDCIHLWDIPDHLSTPILGVVAGKCATLLKPGGMVMMIADNSTALQPFARFLVIGEDCCATMQKAVDRTLPYQYRSNREIEIIMRPLEQYCSFVCMNGTREFLFRVRPSEPDPAPESANEAN